MILDKLENLKKYENLGKGFKTVAEFARANDLIALPLGKSPVSKEVYYNRQEYFGKENGNGLYESHVKYADVQIVLAGEETIDYSPSVAVVSEPNEKDCYFSCGEDKSALHLKAGEFAIFFPGELHRPGLKVNDEKIQKVVFKVLINE